MSRIILISWTFSGVSVGCFVSSNSFIHSVEVVLENSKYLISINRNCLIRRHLTVIVYRSQYIIIPSKCILNEENAIHSVSLNEEFCKFCDEYKLVVLMTSFSSKLVIYGMFHAVRKIAVGQGLQTQWIRRIIE